MPSKSLILPPDNRLERIDEAVNALEQESGVEGTQDVMSPARHSGNGGTGTDTYLQLQDFYKWCFTAGNVRNVHAYEEVGPALPPRGMEEEDQIEMKVYGVSATDQVNTGIEGVGTQCS